MRKWYALLSLCVFSFFSQAQDCNNCKVTPKITMFDFDIKVPPPNSSDTTTNLWPEWKNLFLIASSTGSTLKKNEGNCIILTYPPAIDTGDVQQAFVGGETFTNLPSNPLISSDLSDYGDYLLTGTITSDGTTCKLHAEIQTSCGREVVSKADITFPLSSVIGNVSNIASQVAAQLGPLSKKLVQFEKDTRRKTPYLSLHKFEGDPIRITPQKRTLQNGGSTTFTIELKDCDGTPLAGREVLFGDFDFEGTAQKGTRGGVVTPGKVITDGDGKATATFKLQPGASNEGLIVAHSPGENVKGCKSLFFGTAPVNIRFVYSGSVKYSFTNVGKCTETINNDCSKVVSNSEENVDISYTGVFYARTSDEEIAVTSEETEDSNPLAVPDVMESGEYRRKAGTLYDHVITCESVQKGDHQIQKTNTFATGTIHHSLIQFNFPENDDEGYFSLHLDFDVNETYSSYVTLQGTTVGSNPTKHTVTVTTNTDDKSVKLKREVVGGKVRFTAEGKTIFKSGCGTDQVQTFKAVITRE